MKHNLKFPDGTIKAVDCKLGSGVKDKNGVEIYEGDIIEIDMTPNQPLPIFYHAAVTFKQGAFRLKERPLDQFSQCQLEIVGHVED